MRPLALCLALALVVPRTGHALIPPTQVAQVVGAAGGTAASAGFALTFTVAQPAVGTSTFTNGTLISGFYFPGITVLAVDDGPRAAVSRLVSVGPNPGIGPAAIAFEIGPGDGGVARLDILDIQGRRIRTLVDGPLTPGHHSIEWLGDDDAGHLLPVGVYEARLRTASTNSTLRMVRLH